MLVLFTDSDCDITPEVAQKYGYQLISMPYTVDGKEIYPYIDFEEFNSKEYYDELRKGILPTTSAISPVKYMEYFEPHFAAGNDILYVHFSKAMSGTFNALNLALVELKEKYPEIDKIVGHRDVSSEREYCPCFSVKDEYENI